MPSKWHRVLFQHLDHGLHDASNNYKPRSRMVGNLVRAFRKQFINLLSACNQFIIIWLSKYSAYVNQVK